MIKLPEAALWASGCEMRVNDVCMGAMMEIGGGHLYGSQFEVSRHGDQIPHAKALRATSSAEVVRRLEVDHTSTVDNSDFRCGILGGIASDKPNGTVFDKKEWLPD